MGAEHDRLFHQQASPGRFGAGYRVTVSACLQPSFAFSAEAQQMCTGDAFSLCSSEIPNIPAITACMFKHEPTHRRLPYGDGPELAAKSKKVATND